MPLRSQPSYRPKPASRAAPPRVAVVFACLALLAPLAGSAAAGTGDYASPLYLSRIASSALAGAHELMTSPGSGTPTTPPTTTPVVGLGIPTGFYRYVYTIVDANGSETEPSPVSTPDANTTTGVQNVLVGGLPTGVTVRLYRRKSSTILSYRVAELVNNASATYTDSAGEPPPGAVVLPQAQNRVALAFPTSSCTASNCGYEDFRPGTPAPNAGTSFPQSPPAVSPIPNDYGWIVGDGNGDVAFAGGDWTFRTRVRSGPIGSGDAHLVVGMWKVTTSPAISYSSVPLVDPAVEGEQMTDDLIDTSNTFRDITHTVSVPAFTLGPGERLYVQFWRRQTFPYALAGQNDARILTLAAQDAYSRIEHQGVSTLPDTPVLMSPADGTVTTSSAPVLTATFSDPDAADTGTVEFRVCTTLVGGAGSDCSDQVGTGSSATVANGATASWAVDPALAPGTYYWQARADDGIGTSGWTATRSFTAHTLPDVPSLVAPADGAHTLSSTPTLEASFADADGDSGSVEFRVCSAAAPAGEACSGSVATGSSGSVASGTTGTWTIASAVAVGTYHWQALARDTRAAESAWSATQSFTVHRTPAVPTLVSPAAGAQVRTDTPTLKASFSDPDGDDGSVRFRVCRAASLAGQQCSLKVAAGWSPTVGSGITASWTVAKTLRDGRYYWQARAQDEHGAASAWTATRRLNVAKHLIRILSDVRLECSVGARVSVRIKLAARASVTAIFHNGGAVDLVHAYGRLDAGNATLRKFLSYDLARPDTYWVQWRAKRSGERESAWMRVDLKPLPPSGVPYCRPDS
jgi:hypothetical protein